MMRMAAAAFSTGLATVPGMAGAQAPDQLDVLAQAIRICSDPAMMPAQWDAALSGWVQTEPTPDVIARRLADAEFQLYVADNVSFDSYLPPEVMAEHVYLIDSFTAGIADVEADMAAEDQDLRFYSHESGWQLALSMPEGFIAQSDCTISHQEPDAETLAYLERPYLTAAPFRMIGGRGLTVQTALPDGKAPAAGIEFGLFVLDPVELPADAIPQSHPARFASKVSLQIHVYAEGREARE